MATIQGETIFAYHGLETRTPSSVKVSHVVQVKSLIKDYLEGVQFDRRTPFLKDHDLEEVVWDYFKSLNMGEQIEVLVKKKLKLSVTFVHQAYTSLPFEIRVMCSTLGVYMFLVEDVAEEFMEGLQHFGQNFVLNKGHQHPILTNFDTHLRALSRYYGAYCYSAIIKSLFDYINGRIIESKMEDSGFKFSSDTRLMPMVLRTKVGGAEVLFHMLWPKTLFPEERCLIQYFPIIQEMVIFIDFTNDILSYYKEFINDEKANFVANFGETHQMEQLEVLRYLTLYTPQVLASVRRVLQDKGDLRNAIEQFVAGWIMLCTAHRRYLLVELFADEQYLPPYDEDA